MLALTIIACVFASFSLGYAAASHEFRAQTKMLRQDCDKWFCRWRDLKWPRD